MERPRRRGRASDAALDGHDAKLATIRAWGVEDKENGIAWPAIYVIDRGGRVAWRSVAQTYKVRAGPALILQALEQLGH